jgi:hypothetical protein
MNISKRFRDRNFDLSELRYCFHSGKTGQQKQAEQTANTDLAQQGALTGQAQGTLGQFEGPVQQSPFYKSLMTTGTEATSNAYNNARTNMRARANQAGFGYQQPVEQGAESQLGASEATALGNLPAQTAVEATGPALQAAGQTGGMGMGYGAQGLSALNSAYGMQKGRSGLWNQLFGAGMGAGQGLGEAVLGG